MLAKLPVRSRARVLSNHERASRNGLRLNVLYPHRRAILGPEMSNSEQQSDEVSDREFERDCRDLDGLDRRRLGGKRYAEVYAASNAGEVLGRLSGFTRDWIFRGRKDARWGLKTSIERCAAKGFLNAQESRAFQAFTDRAPTYIQRCEWPKSDLARLALMQHFGGPTRLLDWTEDPDVAALFAVADADRKTASAVWAIQSAAMQLTGNMVSKRA